MAQQISEEQAAKELHDVEQLKTAYQIVFGNDTAGKAVMADLAKFCRANEPCWSENQRHQDRLTGRNEVWWRIHDQLKLPIEELLERRLGGSYRVVKIEPEDDENG